MVNKAFETLKVNISVTEKLIKQYQQEIETTKSEYDKTFNRGLICGLKMQLKFEMELLGEMKKR